MKKTALYFLRRRFSIFDLWCFFAVVFLGIVGMWLESGLTFAVWFLISAGLDAWVESQP